MIKKTTDCNTKISEIKNKFTDHNHDKYITDPEFNTFTAGVFDTRLARASLVMKTDFNTKLTSFNKKNLLK